MTIKEFIIQYKFFIIILLLIILFTLGLFTSRQFILLSKVNNIPPQIIAKTGSRIPSTFTPTSQDEKNVMIYKNVEMIPNNNTYKIKLFENHVMNNLNNSVEITRTDKEFLDDKENKVPILFPLEEIKNNENIINPVKNISILIPAGEAGNYKFMIGTIDKDMNYDIKYKFSANIDTNILVVFPEPIDVLNKILFVGIIKDNQKYIKLSNIIINKEDFNSMANIEKTNIDINNNLNNNVQIGKSLTKEYNNNTPIYYKTIIQEKTHKINYVNQNNEQYVELTRFDPEFLNDSENKTPIIMIFDSLNLYKKENNNMIIDKPVDNIENIFFKISEPGKYKLMLGVVDMYGMDVLHKYNFTVEPEKNMILVKIPSKINIQNKKLFLGILKENSKNVKIHQIVFNFNGEISV